MEKLKYYFKIYFMIISQDIKAKMQYRADFYISTIGMIATNISGIVSFWILFNNIPDILGWNYYELLFIYGFSLLTLTPMQLFFDNIWNINQHVFTGDFIKYCFRPLDIFFYYIAEVFDMKGLSQLVMGALILSFAWIKLGIAVSGFKIILLILTVLSASLVMIAIMVAGSSMAFYIMNATSLMMFLFRFRDFAKYPVTIFNPIFRFIFTFIIPIAFVSFYPAQIFLRPSEASYIAWLSPVVGIVFFTLAYLLWSKGAKQYSGTGS